jgi:hypothetical protein
LAFALEAALGDTEDVSASALSAGLKARAFTGASSTGAGANAALGGAAAAGNTADGATGADSEIRAAPADARGARTDVLGNSCRVKEAALGVNANCAAPASTKPVPKPSPTLLATVLSNA